jgi:hypothetical protein
MLISWTIWLFGLLLVGVVISSAPAVLAQKANVAVVQGNPLTDLVLAILMILFSVAATVLRRRLGNSPRFPGPETIGGVFFWLCLLSFAVCFASGATTLGLSQSLMAENLKFVHIFGGLAVGALLFCMPILPKRSAAAA